MERSDKTLTLNNELMDLFMPMHAVIRPSGHLDHAGPTLRLLLQETRSDKLRFLELFEIRRPILCARSFDDLKAMVGANLRLHPRHAPRLKMKGMIAELPGDDRLLLNLSFGLSIIDAVRELGLSNGDFAPTDLAIEMLYLVEAKSAVMDESRRLNTRLHRARKAAEEQASRDALTGLRNRRAMDAHLKTLVETQTPFGLMHVDLDYFKAVNDTFGHAAGDRVLQAAAGVLVDETRAEDMVARVGGDEFVIVFENLVDNDRLATIAARIVERLEEPVDFQGQDCRISGSIGYTTSKFYSVPDLDRMLSDVDLALYASKKKGRACSTMVTPDLLASASQSGQA